MTSFVDGQWYYVPPGADVACGTITVAGTATLILADGSKLTSNGGIEVAAGKSLTIYGQEGGTGRLEAYGSTGCAGIGGRNPNGWDNPYGNAGSTTINGGIVVAHGGIYLNAGAAGIGGGTAANGGSVTINAGVVQANGSGWAAGIGNGQSLFVRTPVAATVVVRGGNILGGGVSGRPTDGNGHQLYRLTITLMDNTEATLSIEGSSYNTKGLVSMNGQLSVFLPNGTHWITLSKGEKTYSLPVVLNGQDRSIRILKEWIDATAPGGTCTLPDGTYVPGEVPADKSGITIVAENAGKAVVDGGGEKRCLTVNAANVTVDGLVLQNGVASDAENGYGGGVYGQSSTVVQNCTIRECSASNGGGIANAGKVICCRILSCHGKRGGGLYGIAYAFASVISRCSASASAGGAVNMMAYSCTFGEGCEMGGASRAYDCLFHRSGWDSANVEADHSYRIDIDGLFRDPAADDYRLGTLTEWELEEIEGNPDRGRSYASRGETDLYGNPLASITQGILSFCAGCSSSILPSPTLQELIDRTVPGRTCLVPNGIYEKAVIPAEKAGITVVPGYPGGGVVVSGKGVGRCLTVLAENVRLEGLVLSNGVDEADGLDGAGLHVGARGCVITNCTFTGCAASRPGGAVYVAASGGATIARSTFVRCTARQDGGAVCQKGGASVALEGCGFYDCASGSGRSGGAVFAESQLLATIRACLFLRCGAAGAAVEGATCESCTFVDGGLSNGKAADCLFCACRAESSTTDHSYDVDPRSFAGGQFVPSCETAEDCPGDETRAASYLASGLRGFDGRPLAYLEGGTAHLTAGCNAPLDAGITLQELIDSTSPGEICYVPAGTWTSAIVDKPMTLQGAGPAATVVDGEEMARCLDIRSSDVTVAGIGFRNGEATSGAGLNSSDACENVIVSNCIFRACHAQNDGGALAYVRGLVVDCRFEENSADYAGGAAYGSETFERCVFEGNTARLGGAVADCQVKTSLLTGNRAAERGGAGCSVASLSFSGQYFSCTFANNAVGGSTESSSSGVADDSGAVVRDCLFFNCNCAAEMSGSAVAADDPFVDLAGGDFRLRPRTAAELFALIGDPERGRAYAAAGARGLDGQPLAPMRNDVFFFYAGCHGALPTDETLQEKVNRTAAGGTLVLPSGRYTPAVIDRKMTLAAAEPGTVFIDGQGLAGCLKVESGDVQLLGLVLTNGCAAAGGAVCSQDDSRNLLISNCVFTACRSTASAQGGGALAYVRGLVVDCRFEENSAAYAGGAAYRSETFERCVFDGNTARLGGAVADCQVKTSLLTGNRAAERGGAGCSTASLSFSGQYFSCTFVDNRARDSKDDASSGIDGGTASECLFCRCLNAGTGDHSAVVAIDVFVNYARGDYHLNTNDVFALTGLGGDIDRAATYQSKGVLDLDGEPLVVVRGTTRFFYAGCYRAAPARKSLQELIDEASAGDVCEVPGGTFDPAVVPADKTGLVLRGAGTGKTIVNADGNGRCLLVKAKNVRLEGFTFRNGFAASTDQSGLGGGVLENTGSMTLEAVSCSFEYCKAANNGGGICSAGSVRGCKFVACEASYGGGVHCAKTTENCTFTACSASAFGGAVRNTASVSGNVTMGCTFARCTAGQCGGAVCNEGRQGTSDNSRVERCTFTDCTADGMNGGGLENVKDVANCTFSGCSAKANGGGIAKVSSVTGCTFADCTAGTDGGGVHDAVKTEGSEFSNCRAEKGNGGGIRNTSGGAKDNTIRNCKFTACTARGYGGGVQCMGASGDGSGVDNSQVVNCTFTRCATELAGGGGGGGCDNVFLVDGCLFQECEAVEGGGLRNTKKALRCRIERCTALTIGNGGGACAVEELRASLLLKNTAGGWGGGSALSGSYSCTYVQNTAVIAMNQKADGHTAITSPTTVRNCLFYGNVYTNAGDHCATAVTRDFCDAAHDDYHISTKSYNLEGLKGSANAADKVNDLDGIPFVTTVDGTSHFYVGCYAFSPESVKTMVVNVGDNKVHGDSNTLMSLAEVLQIIGQAPSSVTSSGGRYVVQFSSSLVKDDAITIDLVQACLEVPACGSLRIVLEPPAGKRLVFKGNGKWRAIHVAPGATLEVNNAEFAGCLGNSAGASPLACAFDGGAILNDGTLYVNSSVFTGNTAGGGTKIYPAPSGNGGAVMNRGVAVIADSTFTGNEAANGAAVCNSSTGRLTVVSSTFAGNHALAGNSANGNNGGNGGAVAQTATDGSAPETLLVNCTLVGNAADGVGGAVYSEGTREPYALRLVNTVAVGNAGEPDAYLESGSRGRMVSTWYGTRTQPAPAGDEQWDDAGAAGAKGPVDLFASVTADGASALPAVSSAGQVTFPLVNGLATGAKWVRHDADWSTVLVANEKSATSWTCLRAPNDDLSPRELSSRQLSSYALLATDQLGTSFSQPVLGATCATAERTVGPSVPDESDPRQVDSLDIRDIVQAFDLLNLKPEEYAKNGVVTMTFGESAIGGTVRATEPLGDLTHFTNVTLVVRGPITLSSSGACRFFHIGAGNRVVFEDVTFIGGSDIEAGGAIWGEKCELEFNRCVFKDCAAPYGGAICLDFDESEATFATCTFEDNTGLIGRDVYKEPGARVRFLDCELDPNGVVSGVEGDVGIVAEVECTATDGAPVHNYFSRMADALNSGLRPGDTLYLLDADAESLFDKEDLPSYVTLQRKYAKIVNGVVVVEGGGTTLQAGVDLAMAEGLKALELDAGVYAPVQVPEGMDGLVICGTSASACVIDGDASARCVESDSAIVLSNLTLRAGFADGEGGGANGVRSAVCCVFEDCAATVAGGGLAGDGSTEVLLSLFRNCTAPRGAAVSGVQAVNCTFVSTESSAVAVDANATLGGCLTANCSATGGSSTYRIGDPEAEFARWGADYTLKAGAAGRYPAESGIDRARREGWTDLYGNPMVLSIAGGDLLFAGAFAVESPDQTLQAMIDAAEPDGVVEIPAGTYGPAAVPLAKGALVLRPAEGARVTVDGMGLCSALTLNGDATVEGLVITGGSASRGGGVCGVTGGATVRACLIIGNAASLAGGGVANANVANCTFVGNTAPAGSAVSGGSVRASLGATADQTLDACGTPVDWFTAEEDDFTDFAHGDYSILEANEPRFTATDAVWARDAYERRLSDIEGLPLVRRIAGEHVLLAGAYALDCNDALQRLIDFAEGDTVEVPDGAYAPFVVERGGLAVVHAGDPAACTVDGSHRWCGARVTEGDVTIAGMTFKDCAAESGGGVCGGGLTVSNCVFTGCRADLCGGALLVTNAAVVTGCSFTGNAATNLNSAGGAVYAENAVVLGCVFRGNSAVSGGALAAGAGVQAICCTFAGNTATGSSFAETASAAHALEEGQTLADCVFCNDTQTGFALEGRTISSSGPFVGADDLRLRPEFFAAAADYGAAAAPRVAAVRSAGGVMPGGASLVASVAATDMLFAGACGVAAENTLQALIDAAPAGGSVLVGPGAYLPAVIPEGKGALTITGADGATVEGYGMFRCLTVKSAGVTLRGLTFANGAATGDGGGVGGESVAAVIGCTFTNCTATGEGGGIAGAGEIRGCRFVGNRAGTSGGGASQPVRDVIGSVFAFNAAGTSDAACHASGGDAGRFDFCTVFANTNGAAALDAPAGDFCIGDDEAVALADPAGGDFRLRPEEAMRFAVDDFAVATNALAQGWPGADGQPLARAAGDWAVMTRGAVNGWDMTVQSAVDGAARGDVVEVAEGVYPPLFVGSGKYSVTIRPQDGAHVAFDGAGRFRAVTDASQRLTLAGLMLTNGVATAFDGFEAFGTNGGGYCGVPGSGATLDRCAVAGCAADGASGGGVYGADAVVSAKITDNRAASGGGVAGVRLVRTSLILRNHATDSAGGVDGRLEGISVQVRNCTFVDNASDADPAGSGLCGGADVHNVFFGCARAEVTDSTGVALDESPFVDAEAGDWRVMHDWINALAVMDLSYASAARSEGWVSPDGDPLSLRVVGADVIMAGAYGPDLDMRLQQWVDAAHPGDTVEVPAGVYAPATVDVGGIAIVATGAPGSCVIVCADFYRGLTVNGSDVTISGLTVSNGNAARWAGNGGAILGDGSTTVASNCTFVGCVAVNGGATAGMKLVSGSVYRGCTARDQGGGSYGDAEVRASLFEANTAATNGAAASQSALKNCTVAANAVVEPGGETLGGGSADYTVFCGSAAVAGTGNLATNESFFVTGTWRPTWVAALSNRVADADYVTAAAAWTDPDGRKLVFEVEGATALTVGAYAPLAASALPPVAAKTVIRMRDAMGNESSFANAADAAAAFAPGSRVEIAALGTDDVGGGSAGEVEAAFREIQGKIVGAAQPAVAGMPWYTVEATGLCVAANLNELATPMLDDAAEIDLTGSETEVSVMPTNVKPGLWYGLGRSETPEGPFIVEEGGWVQADANGVLPRALTAPKSGVAGFYRVIVR